MSKQERCLSTMRRILVPLDSKVAAKTCIESAFMVAKSMKAHVGVLLINGDPTKNEDNYPPNVEDMPPPAGVERVRGKSQITEARALEVRSVFEDLCKKYNFPVVDGVPPLDKATASFSEDVGKSGQVLARHGRRSDMIVISKPSSVLKMRSGIDVNAALFETGRPVLVAPPSPPVTLAEKIAVAWNDSAEASRAVAAAMRFIVRAKKVTVLTAESVRTPAYVAQELVDYFAYHGVSAESKIFEHMGDQPLGGKALLDECTKAGADLLVMGAYNVSSFREIIMGTATKQVLAATSIPLLMAR